MIRLICTYPNGMWCVAGLQLTLLPGRSPEPNLCQASGSQCTGREVGLSSVYHVPAKTYFAEAAYHLQTWRWWCLWPVGTVGFARQH